MLLPTVEQSSSQFPLITASPPSHVSFSGRECLHGFWQAECNLSVNLCDRAERELDWPDDIVEQVSGPEEALAQPMGALKHMWPSQVL